MRPPHPSSGMRPADIRLAHAVLVPDGGVEKVDAEIQGAAQDLARMRFVHRPAGLAGVCGGCGAAGQGCSRAAGCAGCGGCPGRSGADTAEKAGGRDGREILA